MAEQDSDPKSRWGRRILVFVILFMIPIVLGVGYRLFLEHRPIAVGQLLNPETRLYTFYRLWRTEDHEEIYQRLYHWNDFRGFHGMIEILECPQDEEPPLYLIFSEPSANHFEYLVIAGVPTFDPPMSKISHVIKPDQWKGWWSRRKAAVPIQSGPPLVPRLDRFDGWRFDVFDSNLNRIQPFDGNNSAEGVFYDVNQDGYIERVESAFHSFEAGGTRVFAEILTVAQVRKEQEFLFSVVLNLERKGIEIPAWEWECSDLEGDGLAEIHLGPRNSAGAIDREVTFQWDAEAGTYVSLLSAEVPRVSPYIILEGRDGGLAECAAMIQKGKDRLMDQMRKARQLKED